MSTASRTAWRQRTLAAGRCVGCAGSRDGEQLMCVSCRMKRSRREKARREARRAAGLVKPKGWNGLHANPQNIRRLTPAEARDAGESGGLISGRRRYVKARETAVREARRILATLRHQQPRADRRAVVMADVLHRLYERAYELGYAKGWRQRKRRVAQPKEEQAA